MTKNALNEIQKPKNDNYSDNKNYERIARTDEQS